MSLAHVIHHLLLMPTGLVHFSCMDLQVSCHCLHLQPCSDRSLTYSHLPTSIAHIIIHPPLMPGCQFMLPKVSSLLSTHLAMSSSDHSFLARFSSRPNTRLSAPCMSSLNLGGMKVTSGSHCCSQFGRHTPRLVVFFSVHTFGNKTDIDDPTEP